MGNEFSQLVKVRLNKASGNYSVNILFDLHERVKVHKYLECRQDPTTGGILYLPIQGM